MNTIGFEAICSEIDILIKIYNYLRFEDQLSLAQVNVLALSVFRTYICKANYESLEVRDHGSLHVVVKPKDSANWIYLHHKLFKHFLAVYAQDVDELAVDSLETIDCLGVFRNLNALSVVKTCLPLHFDVVVENCPKLRSLEVIIHSLDMPQAYGKRLRQIRHLKRLALTVHADIEYADFREFVTTLKIEHLQLKAAIKYEEIFNKKREAMLPRPYCLRELDVTLGKYYGNSDTNAIFSCLVHCENLEKLSIQLNDLVMTDQALQLICLNCKNLKTLTLHDCVCDIGKFSLPPDITEIALLRCQGLTCRNLSQVLSHMNVRKFNSQETTYTGPWHNFYMMPFMECLTCDAVDSLTLLAASERSQKSLRELTWYCREYENEAALVRTCPNLEILNIECNPLALDTLEQLKHLTILRFEETSHLNWSHIVALLKRIPLQELCFNNTYGHVGNFPTRGFATSVKAIKIREGSAISAALAFWLDLLTHNGQLQVMWFNIFGLRRFLKALLRSRNFPKDLRIINISGINITCNTLRRCFNDVIMQFSFLNFDNRHVTLCRNI